MLDINNQYSNLLYYEILKNIDGGKKIEYKNGLIDYTIVYSNKIGYGIKDTFIYDKYFNLIDIKTEIFEL